MKSKLLWTIALLLVLALGAFAVFILPRPDSPNLAQAQPTRSSSSPVPGLSPINDPFRALRLAMVEDQIVARGITDTSVLEVMRTVPRHEFVLSADLDRAYEDHPLPIGFGQTISQPYIVALMTQLLNLRRSDKVLEIGTGSGYQAAVLAHLTDQVWTVEIIPELAQSAAARLKRLGYSQVAVKNADGYDGWAEHAPFDAIVVTAAPDHVPPPLVQQLKEGGRLVVPIGPPGSYQTLWRITKRNGQVVSENITGVIFVPLVRGTR